MKTVLINASPKKSFSASAYFLAVQKVFVRGKKIKETLRTKKDYERIRSEIKDADAVVFCLPLYVDGVPSHVLPFLKEMEQFCKENNLKLILDAAHMAGTRYKGEIPGKEAEVVVYSFQAVKNLPTADSGMICNTKQRKHPACTPTGEQISKTMSICAAGCSLTTSAATWMNLAKMMLRKRTQTPKATCGVIPRMSKVQDKQTCRDRK